MLPVLLDIALRPSDVIKEFWPCFLIGALVLAAIAAAIVLIVVFSKKKKKK